MNQPDNPPVKSRLPADQRRKAIVDAAVQLFAQNGFRGTTTRQIAHAVGVTEPVLYMHFETKRDLYSAMIESISSGTPLASCDPICHHTGDDAVFTSIASGILRWHVEDPTRIRLLLFSALEGHELSDLFYQGHIVPFMKTLAAYIERRIEDGAFRRVDAYNAARAFCGMIAQFGQSLTVFRTPCPEDSRKEVVHQMVAIFLNGMRKPEDTRE